MTEVVSAVVVVPYLKDFFSPKWSEQLAKFKLSAVIMRYHLVVIIINYP